ncbi:MAG: hypothetical protein WD073_07830 [Xanthobacteraceae bacterium]
MDWGDVAKSAIGLGAPILGAALGGPLGGAAGKILADALGASAATPAAVSEALARAQADATAAMQVAAAAREAEAQWLAALAEAGKAQVVEVGRTMRAEAASDDPLQRWWRPLYALELTLFECPGFAAVLGHALWNGNAEAINGLADTSGLIITYIAARFGVLGVYVSGRTREKQAALTGGAVPSLVGEVVRAIAGRR